MDINVTLIGQAGTFLVFILFTMKFVWPPIKEAMDKRREEIADGLAAAERGQREQELAQQRAEETIREARNQAAEIVDQANKRGTEIVEEAKASARAEGERIKESAQSEIEQEVNRAREKLRAQVATLSVTGAERVLRKEVDAAAHERMLDDLVSEL